MSSVFETYRQTAVQTAPQEQLIIMLYDGAVRFLEQAKSALQEGKDASGPIGRAQDIIIELAASLNREAGGEIAANLGRLYDFWLNWLIQAHVRRDPAKVEEVLVMVRELREAWVTIAQQQKRAATPAAGQAAPLNARG
jgi:flagellar secretion chaperone FliS